MNAFLIVVVVVLPAIGAFIALRRMQRDRGSLRATARVVGHKREDVPGPPDRRYTWRDLPIVEFADERGKMHRVTLREEIWDTQNEVRVVFPPGRPAEARLHQASRRYLVPGLLIGPGLALVLLYALASLYAALSG